MDSMREFGVSCKVYFQEMANEMIDYFNEISEDYRAIAEQLEREWTVKFKEHLKSVQERRGSRGLGESSASAEGDHSGKITKVDCCVYYRFIHIMRVQHAFIHPIWSPKFQIVVAHL